MDTLDPSPAPDIQIIFNPDHVSDMICFENTHDIAQHLSTTQPTVATALLEELLYWRSAGRI